MRKISDNDFNVLVRTAATEPGRNAKQRKAVKMVARALRTEGKRGWPAMARALGLAVAAVRPSMQPKLTPKQRVLSKYPNARLMADNEEGGYRVVKGEGLAVMLGAGPTANAAWAAAAKAV